MSYTYIYDPAALKEYKQAITWYHERSNLASENFVKEVGEKIELICNNPLLYRNVYKYFRQTSLKKYPYSIVYFVNEVEKKIIISSVYHHKRSKKEIQEVIPKLNFRKKFFAMDFGVDIGEEEKNGPAGSINLIREV